MRLDVGGGQAVVSRTGVLLRLGILVSEAGHAADFGSSYRALSAQLCLGTHHGSSAVSIWACNAQGIQNSTDLIARSGWLAGNQCAVKIRK